MCDFIQNIFFQHNIIRIKNNVYIVCLYFYNYSILYFPRNENPGKNEKFISHFNHNVLLLYSWKLLEWISLKRRIGQINITKALFKISLLEKCII